jgi:hypothetical protein
MTTADTDGSAEDRLVALYRNYIGEPDRRTDVYLGFALFFGGLGLGLIGLLLFGIERTALAGEVFWLRELAFAGGAFGLPLVLFSVVVLLPADRRALYVAAAGLVVTIAAIAFFVSVYPSNWNAGADYSLRGVTIYAVGVVSVLASTGAALVSYHIERVSGGPGTAAEEAEADTDPDVTDEQVQQDIDEAMSNTEINWGGVEKVDTERLNITPDAELEGENLDQSSANVHRSKSVDEQLSALQGLKGGENRTDTSDSVDDQAAALQELREQQRQEAEAEPDGVWERLKKRLSG